MMYRQGLEEPVQLFAWPEAARFNRIVAKESLLKHGKMSSDIRRKLTDQVRQIRWAYKLADSTINLPGTDSVPEIQVFTIALKGEELDEDVLAAIDRAVQYPIIFEVTTFGDAPRTKLTAAHKTFAPRSVKLSGYYSSDWIPASFQRAPLPVAVDLVDLHQKLLEPLFPRQLRDGETMTEASERLKQVKKLERQLGQLQRRMLREPQFNREVALRQEIRRLQGKIERLM